MDTPRRLEIINEHFDAGRELDPELREQILSDPKAAAYLAQIERLEQDLERMPLELPSPGLALRIKAQVAAEAAQTERPLQEAVGALGILTAASLTILFLYPFLLEPVSVWRTITEWIVRIDLAGMGTVMIETVMSMWTAIVAETSNALPLGNVSLSVVLAASLAGLLGLHVFEVRRLRDSDTRRTAGREGL